MTPPFTPTVDRLTRQSGFTILEMLFVVVIIGLLAAIALPMYQSYAARSQAAELALKFDAVRTNIQVAAKTGEVQNECANLVGAVHAANLSSEYAQLAVNFEAVAGGFTPVLTMCATTATQGNHGVEVAREAHHLLSRNSVISQGAVLGGSAVSFSVKLAGDASLCKVPPASSSGKVACAAASVPTTASKPQGTASTPSTAASGPSPVASVPVPVASSPKPLASMPVPAASRPGASASTVAQANTANTQPGTCNGKPAQQLNRQVMRFTGSAGSYIKNVADLNTNGNLPALTAEVVIAGDSNNAPGATLMSYTPMHSATGFSLWNPASLHITLAGTEYNTGVNVDDRQPHRITMSWRQTGGTLVLYDNGREVWRQLGVNTNGTLGGSGTLVIGQDARPASGGGLRLRDGYTGSIVAASLASRAVSAAQAGSGPLHTVLQANSGLLTDVVMGANGQPVDTTGNANYVATGVKAQSAPISTAVYADKNCQ
jgi:prepilin-type N-terminal cleavage/methylation domain-containing protein